jgi:ribosomal protein RSM22 (predicted rRNA methylase)
LSAEATIQQGLAWSLQAHAETLANRSTVDAENKLWDVWAQTRLSDVLEELLQQADQAQIAIMPLRAKLGQINQWTTKNASTQIELAGRAGMLNPGNRLQRFLMGLTAISETLLPIVAMAIVAYQVFSGYYQSAHQSIAYLGVDFAVHSILLIGLSWLIPFFLHKKLQPSLQKAALSGLNKGLRQVLVQLQFQIEQAITEVEHGNQACAANLVEIIKHAAQENDLVLVREPLLSRVLVDK